jgi:hypothetical protein
VWRTNWEREYGVWFATNAHGDPDRERAPAKPPGVYRVAVLGDSMVEAAQVPAEERFTDLLEHAVAASPACASSAAGGRGRAVEVLNFGVAGYGTAQEWLYYRGHARRFAPDLVLLVFSTLNDVRNNGYELEVVEAGRPEIAPFFRLAADGGLALANPGFHEQAVARFDPPRGRARRAYEWLRDRLRLSQLVVRLAAGLEAGPDGEDAHAGLEADSYRPAKQAASPAWAASWALTAELLRRFAADAAAAGADFHVVLAPGIWEVDAVSRERRFGSPPPPEYDWDFAHRETTAMLRRLGLEHTTLLPALRAAGAAGEPPYFEHDGHWTAAGHRVVAGALEPLIEARACSRAASRAAE